MASIKKGHREMLLVSPLQIATGHERYVHEENAFLQSFHVIVPVESICCVLRKDETPVARSLFVRSSCASIYRTHQIVPNKVPRASPAVTSWWAGSHSFTSKTKTALDLYPQRPHINATKGFKYQCGHTDRLLQIDARRANEEEKNIHCLILMDTHHHHDIVRVGESGWGYDR